MAEDEYPIEHRRLWAVLDGGGQLMAESLVDEPVRRGMNDEIRQRPAGNQGEREVLALMAEGRTNIGIARRLWPTDRTVETHVGSILAKLGLAGSDEDHRWVLAVLAYLGEKAAG